MTPAAAATTVKIPLTRLGPLTTSRAVWGWAGPLLVTALGTWLRFAHLSTPRALVFDEVFYAPQAFGILHYGTEHLVSTQFGTLVLAGKTDIFVPGAQFSAHPPFGKIQIAAGEWLFGLTPFGWRFAAALAGSLSILLLARIARRMTGSVLLGCAAGLLLALDGLEFVLSRTAMLDIFVMFWALAGFGCLVIDRDKRTADPAGGVSGRRSRLPWWRLAAGACLGLAVASKWNGLYFLVLFLPLAVATDWRARREAALPWPPWRAARDTATAAASIWLPAAVTYLASWSGWFATGTGWDRHYAHAHGVRAPVVSALYSLLEYHRQMLDAGLGLQAHQSFQSPAAAWLSLRHPVPFYYAAPPYGVDGCRAVRGCVQEVLAVSTPALWWPALAALAVCAVWWLLRRDWRPGAVLLAAAAGWLPWLAFPGRSEYSYYAVAFVPYLVLALTLCLALIAGPAGASPPRRRAGAAVTALYLLAVAWTFGYLYPVLTASALTPAAWHARMWFPGWV
jgi:dolichyl-phosphate-mannose-protein mannosyltransferase